MDWFTLSLLCAFSLAAADAATKAWLADYRASELALVRFGATGLLISPLIPDLHFLADLPASFWLWIMFLVPLEIAAMLLYMQAIRDHPLSMTLPYLAFTPVFVILTGSALLGEAVDLQGLSGIMLVVAGAWLLNQEHASVRDWRTWGAPLTAILHEPGPRMMLGVALIYSLTATMGKGAMAYMEAGQFGAFYFALLAVVSVPIFAFSDPPIIKRMWRRPAPVLTVGLLNGAMVYTHFLALQRVEVAYMIAVKRTSLLFGILFGAVFFGERGLRARLMAASLMLGGVSLILL